MHRGDEKDRGDAKGRRAAQDAVSPAASEMTGTSTRAERRRATRRLVLKAGIVAFNDRHSTLPCRVRNISETGARLEIGGSLNAPDTFDLIIEIDGLEARCEVIRRNGNQIAVRFVSPPRITASRRVQVIKAYVPVQPPSLRRKSKPGEPC
ncbi:MAG: PilZ domain-containing protein [Hyphomicrobiaceae bacterium]|nr:MAG: PilZ domain-containing protein [Hyphomicrobiaceae bacterium]